MKFMPILMDLIPVEPVEPVVEAEIIEKGPELSTVLIAAGVILIAVALIASVIKKNKK